MSPAIHWCVAGVFVSAVMTAVYIGQRKTKNAGYVDVAWAACIGMIVLFLALVGDGDSTRRAIVAIIAGAWSFRLAGYLFQRIRKDEHEDGRYANLRKSWGDSFEVKIFWFYQAQAAAVLLFALAPWLAMQATRESPDLWDFAGASIAAIGLGGAALADMQLNRFRNQATNRGKTCQVGLWKYSRHPNYFFEWVHWWGYVCISVFGPCWWLTPLTPLMLLYVLLFKTGIPATEAQALASRGDEYRKYQETTSAFIPWFPKRQPAATNSRPL